MAFAGISYLAVLAAAIAAFAFGALWYGVLGKRWQAAAFLWAAFVLTTMIVNHRFHEASWSLTLIDGGHWLGALLVIALAIGWIGV